MNERFDLVARNLGLEGIPVEVVAMVSVGQLIVLVHHARLRQGRMRFAYALSSRRKGSAPSWLGGTRT